VVLMMMVFVLVLVQPSLGWTVVVVGFTATGADAPCWPTGFVVFITVLDIQLCQTGGAAVACVAEHNTKADVVDDKDFDDADAATTICCRMVSNCSHKLGCVANRMALSKTMVLMCIERMMVMINFTMMTIALIRHITTAKALPSHVGLIAWFQWVVCVNGTLLFWSSFDLHTRQQSLNWHWHYHSHPPDQWCLMQNLLYLQCQN